MPNVKEAPAEAAGTAEVTISSAYDAALATLEGQSASSKGTSKAKAEVPEEGVAAEAASSEDAGTTEVEVEEPEYIKWVKSIDGDSDPKTGEIIIDKVAKRAFELNKQAQTNAQKLNQLNQLLQHPALAPHVQRIIAGGNGEVVEAKPEEKKDRTDEEVLEDWVNKRIEDRLKPLVEENRMLYNQYAENTMAVAYSKLKDEFGADDAGKPMYDSVREQVGEQLAAAATQAGVKPQDLWNELIKRGTLYDTLASTARNILYPQLT